MILSVNHLFTLLHFAGGISSEAENHEKESEHQSSEGTSHRDQDFDGYRSLEHKLLQDIFMNYDRRVRPAKEPRDVISVFIELSLLNILKLDSRSQIFHTNSELILRWTDNRLTWEPQKYENITIVEIPVHEIWSPDIVLYNTAEADYKKMLLATNVIMKSDGLIEWVAHATLASICNIDVQWYPFDQQICTLKFASWSYDEGQMRLILGPSDLSNYNENPEYFLENFYSLEEDMFNPCCELPVHAVTYFIQIQRRSKFALFFFTLPGILINICSLLVFSLPSESGEKINLGISAMLGMTLFLMEITKYIPPTEKLPLIGVYFGICTAMIAANVTFSVFIWNLKMAGIRDQRIPTYFKWLTLLVAKIFRNHIPQAMKEKWELEMETSSVAKLQNFVRTHPFSSGEDAKCDIESKNEHLEDSLYKPKDAYEQRTLKALDIMMDVMNKEEKQNEIRVAVKLTIKEWEVISRIYDRFLFYGFCIILLLVNLLELTSSPFRERFEYCPFSKEKCEGLTTEEIMELIKSGEH